MEVLADLIRSKVGRTIPPTCNLTIEVVERRDGPSLIGSLRVSTGRSRDPIVRFCPAESLVSWMPSFDCRHSLTYPRPVRSLFRHDHDFDSAWRRSVE